jgi:hypothetical protein
VAQHRNEYRQRICTAPNHSPIHLHLSARIGPEPYNKLSFAAVATRDGKDERR